MLNTRILSPTDQKCADSSSIIANPVNFDLFRRSLKCDAKNSTYIYTYIYHPLDNLYGFLSIGNTKNHVATLTCLQWILKYVVCVCALLIDNVGNYLYLNNGRFKFEVDPHQFNLRLHHFSQFQRIKKKKLKSWQVCDWLAKWLIILGFMDLRWPRVYRRSNVCLVYLCISSLGERYMKNNGWKHQLSFHVNG